MGPSDLIAVDLINPHRVGEVQALRFDSGYRWLYFSLMQTNEVIVLKCFDSAMDGRSRSTAHCAFEDPSTTPDSEARESVEVRVLAFFDKAR